MKRLAILGASGHGKVVADCAECAGWSDVLFFDDDWPDVEKNGAWSVIGGMNELLDSLKEFDGVIVAIGDNEVRFKKHVELFKSGANMVSVIHPSSDISKYVELDMGCAVMPGAVVNVGSKIGPACIVNTGATIDHDCTIGGGVHISPGAHLAGGVMIGKGVWVGMGANIRQLIKVGEHSIVGAGAVVVNNVEKNSTVIGVPASLLK